MIQRDKSQPLHLKYRPKTFDEFIGNEATIEALKSVVSRTSGEVRSFLFTGPSGCGKTTLARIVASELNCQAKDIYEYNSANTRGIDTIREIAQSSRYLPLGGKIKVYLLDEIHKATADAQNALLKLLEDTPKHIRFILCTTDPEKLIKTIKTRCSTFTVSSLQRSKIMKLLHWICSEEKVKVEEAVLQKIAECCDGSARQGIVFLDQIIDIENQETALQAIVDATVQDSSIKDLIQKLLQPGISWKTLTPIIKSLDEEPEQIRRAILGYCEKVMLDSPNERLCSIIEIFWDSWTYVGRAGLIRSCYRALNL